MFPFRISNVMRSVLSSVRSLYVVIGHFPSRFRQSVGSLIDVIGSRRCDFTVTRQDALPALTEARTEARKSKVSLKQKKGMEDEAQIDDDVIDDDRHGGWWKRGAIETQMVAVHTTAWVHEVMNTGMIKIYQKNILGPRWRRPVVPDYFFYAIPCGEHTPREYSRRYYPGVIQVLFCWPLVAQPLGCALSRDHVRRGCRGSHHVLLHTGGGGGGTGGGGAAAGTSR